MIKNQRAIYVFLLISIFMLFAITFFADKEENLEFSVESGFYDDSFELVISGPRNCDIYYTIDGSIPNKNSIRYNGPIEISDATFNENNICMNSDVTVNFYEEILQQYSSDKKVHYKIPDYLVDKCTVIRAIGYTREEKELPVKTECYFVGFSEKIGYGNVDYICINTDSNNLFDYENGIYVAGKTFDDFLYSGDILNDPKWQRWGANYHNRGKEWEREANVIVFEDGEEVINQTCGIRIQGSTGCAGLPRSFNIYSRDELGDAIRFNYSLFNDGYVADTMTLFAGGTTNYYKINDPMIAELVKDRNIATMTFQPYVLFLNGEYWGMYFITEKYDECYFKSHYNLNADDEVLFIKGGEVADGNDEDLVYYTDVEYIISNLDFTNDDSFDMACSYIDMQSYIDYYSIMMYLARGIDWPVLNEGMWCTKNNGTSSYADGLWRWVLYDLNSSCMHYDIVDENTINITREKSSMFDNLCKSEEFKKCFTITSMDIMNTCFEHNKVDDYIDSFKYIYNDELLQNNKRFFASDMQDEIHYRMDEVSYFFNNRNEYMIQYIADEFEISNETIIVDISVNDDAWGYVQLNTINKVPFVEDEWTGEYFKEYEIVLTAVPYEGHEFVGWRGDIDSDENELEVILSDYSDMVHIEVVFQ